MDDLLKPAYVLVRDELIKQPGDAIVTFVFPGGHQLAMTSASILDMVARKIKLPDRRNSRVAASKKADFIKEYKAGTELWIFGLEMDGYTRLLDEEGWLYTSGIKLCC